MLLQNILSILTLCTILSTSIAFRYATHYCTECL